MNKLTEEFYFGISFEEVEKLETSIFLGYSQDGIIFIVIAICAAITVASCLLVCIIVRRRHCEINLKPLEINFDENSEGKLRGKGRCLVPLKYLTLSKQRGTNSLNVLHDNPTHHCTESEETPEVDENKVTDTLISTQLKNEKEAIKILETDQETSKVSFYGGEPGGIFVFM